MSISQRNLAKQSAQYELRNLEGFEGDTIMKERVRKIIQDHNIDLVIEGGTYLGGTARQFAEMCHHVITIEINPEFYERAKSLLGGINNVSMFFGDTVSIFPQILRLIDPKENILFWLDSHWGSDNPLLAELEIIANAGIRPVIAIHDFKVPGHPELGFDTYGDIVYEWSWIEKSIEKIYGVEGFTVEYNSEAMGAKRGVIYIWPR